MTQPKPEANRDQALVDTLVAAKNDKFEVWKYFEERASKLSDQLWSIGIWLMSIIAAALSLPFLAPNFIEISRSAFLIGYFCPTPRNR